MPERPHLTEAPGLTLYSGFRYRLRVRRPVPLTVQVGSLSFDRTPAVQVEVGRLVFEQGAQPVRVEVEAVAFDLG